MFAPMTWMNCSAKIVLCVVTIVCAGGFARAQAFGQTGAVDDKARIQLALHMLAADYNSGTGLWKTEGWWNAANTVTALADAAALDPQVDARATLGNTFRQAQNKFPSFRNEYYDDEGWWALAWIQAYDVTHQTRFLRMSESIFQDMTTGWDDTCGGGIWWKKDRHYKNAIANELFLSVASHLANRTSGKSQGQMLAWARREWAWFEKSGMINGDSLVNDGLTSDCRNNGRNTWTYNQGVVLGALLELSKATGQDAYRRKADVIASSAVERLTDAEHVLHDQTEPNCSADSVQFKGIFVRNLGELQRTSPSENYAKFLRINADSVWLKALDGDTGFACSWSGPAKSDGAAATTSALDGLLAVR